MNLQTIEYLRTAEAIVRKTSLVGDHPIFPNELFDWAAALEEATENIIAEYRHFAQKVCLADMPNFQDVSVEQRVLTTDDKWKILPLMAYGEVNLKTISHLPITYETISRITGITTCMFSILSPHKHIPPHRGPYAGVLRCHLPLQVPVRNENCWIRVHDQKHRWQRGKALIFDDTYEHEALNDSEEYRIVLFIDFLRPLPDDVSAMNRKLVDIFRCSDFVQIPKSRYERWESGHL